MNEIMYNEVRQHNVLLPVPIHAVETAQKWSQLSLTKATPLASTKAWIHGYTVRDNKFKRPRKIFFVTKKLELLNVMEINAKSFKIKNISLLSCYGCAGNSV
ncbi:hypothetical protein RRG08_000741 [Elysia crispata]|uniref:Uncharacterized protein n=1 Tax=Elysia crispata TaxID=231223 RepID=A0AAE1DXF0_9GAST|nr:hypothetical protein RRG08_000741 [Elysia crispata]